VNFSTAKQLVKDFINKYLIVVNWDLDNPDGYNYTVNGKTYPINSGVELPAQSVLFRRGEAANSVICEAIFYYRLRYKFFNKLSVDDLPIRGVEDVLATIQMAGIMYPPSSQFIKFQPVPIPDCITVGREESLTQDWLVDATFGFDIEFKASEFPDVSGIQPISLDQGELVNPATLTIVVNRAKPNFAPEKVNTYTKDTEITINYQ
jgi:hypothetical protein